jgi:DNA-binding NarL/FixJ family response regulator
VARAQVLPAAVEVLLAAGDEGAAREASTELASIASGFQCTAVSATAAYAAGRVALASGDPAAAMASLRRAWKGWIDVGCRYEAAWARVRIAVACRELGDEDSALSELAVAGRAFAEIGAAPASAEVERLASRHLPDGLTAREAEVLRLVASGKSNPQIAAALFLSQKTVQRHLSNIFTKTGVTSRTAAAAYAFEHQLA